MIIGIIHQRFVNEPRIGVAFHFLAETCEDIEALEMIQAKAGTKMSGSLEILEPTDTLTWEIKLRLNEVKE